MKYPGDYSLKNSDRKCLQSLDIYKLPQKDHKPRDLAEMSLELKGFLGQ